MHFIFSGSAFIVLICLTAASPPIPPSAVSPRPTGESFDSVVPVGIIKSSVGNTDDSPSRDIEPIRVVYFNKTSIGNATELAEPRKWRCGAGFPNLYFDGDYTTLYIRNNNNVFLRSIIVNVDRKFTFYQNNDFTIDLQSPPLCEGKYTFPVVCEKLHFHCQGIGFWRMLATRT